MKFRHLPSLLICALLVAPGSARAQGIPVYDGANYAQILSQLNQMSQQYQKQLQQLDQAIQQTSAITGGRNMGSLDNGPLEQELRRYLPNTWQDTMKMMGAPGLSGTALGTQSLYSTYYSTFSPVTGAAAMTRDPTGAIAQSVDQKTQTTYASMAASEQAYNSIEARISRYESLLNQLNSTTDLKASVDLQSRIAVENGMILNELMRLNAVQIQQKSATDNEELTSFKQASAANRFDATKAATAYKLQE